jgi:hypothetical protein
MDEFRNSIRSIRLTEKAGWSAVAVSCALALAACASEHAAIDTAPLADGAFSFVVIGDTPYAAEDEAMLGEAASLVRDGRYPFVIHVGDYKGGMAPCTAEHDERFAGLIAALAPTPVIYTPGDNEWTDCDRNKDETTGKPYSDLARFKRVRERFFAEAPLTPKAFEFERQNGQPENASWRHEGVRFATLHVVGTANGRNWVTGDPLAETEAAVDARESSNAAWLRHAVELARREGALALVIAMQADPVADARTAGGEPCVGVVDHDRRCDAFIDLRRAIRDAAVAFGRPVLVIHGDTAPFTLNQDFAGDEAANLWRLNAAGDAGVGVTREFYGTRDVTLVNVDAKSTSPFGAQGLVNAKAPDR